MSDLIKCPECGIVETQRVDDCFEFACESWMDSDGFYQSSHCKDHSISELRRKVAELEGLLAREQGRIATLSGAVRTALKMRREYVEMDEEGDGGYAAAYHSFWKGKDEEWATLVKSLEAAT